MNNLRRSSILFCCALFWESALQNGYAWQPQSPQPVPTAGTSRRIALDVVVTDNSGNPVSGLQQQDFTILDNKQPSNILSFEAVQGDAAPVEVILLIDGINTSFTHVSY